MWIQRPKHCYPKELRSNIARAYDLRFARGIELQFSSCEGHFAGL